MENFPNIVTSGLSRTFLQGHDSVKIEIYRLENDDGWTLAVVARDGTPTIWDEAFASDREALSAAINAVKKDGITSFLESAKVLPFRRR